MKKYILMRTLRSIVSIILVTALTYTIVYTLVPASLIFKQDPNYNKMTVTPDKKEDYVNTIFEKMGYIAYDSSKELKDKVAKENSKVTADVTASNKKIYSDYIKKVGKGWQLKQMPQSKNFYAVRSIPIYERVGKFFAQMVVIDHPWKIKDKSNPNLERYVRLENDPAIGWSVVGSGTKHKYLLYVNGRFPFIHQNVITFNLGESYPTYAGLPVLDVISQGQGKTLIEEVTFPTGITKKSSIDLYSRTYRSPDKADDIAQANFGKGDAYTATKNRYQDPSMLANSMTIGIIGVLVSYLIGLPFALLLARLKNTWFDSLSTASMTFLMALPSIALIYVIRSLGGLFGLPDNFPLLGAGDVRSYLLPAVIIGFLGVPGVVIWFRRYLVDLQSSDYIRFARAKGLSEKEIYRDHLFKNALVPVVNGIPDSIISTIAGATLIETIFAFPGMGKMLIDAIRQANNGMIIALTFIFTTLSIFSLLAGDLLMTLVDPRIKLNAKKGGKS